MAEKKKGKMYTAKHGKLKGRKHLSQNRADATRFSEKPNKDIYNRADESLERMINNKGIPRVQEGWR